jgi:hypothetical protein
MSAAMHRVERVAVGAARAAAVCCEGQCGWRFPPEGSPPLSLPYVRSCARFHAEVTGHTTRLQVTRFVEYRREG